RITTQKTLSTPRGIFELKYFFSSQVLCRSGEPCSTTAIRALIKKLILAENKSHPLSDNKLAELLALQGFCVARRTITKYRETLMIPASSERKQVI
ncbi:MAG TPA: RNA polymerase factor sigma-54, partial [Gammaproteobacteria bacterium]|nr:RNA polymerase factor sigma-54 [Gammaproteobacteria bacterium]